MEDSVKEQVDNILQNITRYLNCLGDDNRNSRKRSLESIKREIIKTPSLKPDVLHAVLTKIASPLLKLLSDSVEKCRELSVTILFGMLDAIPSTSEFLQLLIPVLAQRLGQQDIVEPSEELRLQLVELLTMMVEKTKKEMHPYLDDLVKILQRTIVDPYPEVKKQSCTCATAVATAIPEYFHMQSESLIQPLLCTISHQHSRVRVAAVMAIGSVIQNGNGKSVDDVVSHLAQRLFDSTPQVRQAVTRVVGNWLLDLPDRYSFHHKLLPLLLTSMTDEVPDICREAETLWYDIGMKYESENENDLKDKQDFSQPDPEHYPKGVERPNLGCRTLMYRNFSKILSGLVRDITDWVAATRIKSAQLLYTMLLNEEENTTQHLEKVLTGLYKASGDEETAVQAYVKKSAELVGYFVPPEVWVKMILDHVKASQSRGSLMVLAAVIRGSQRTAMQPYLLDICSVLADSDICRVADGLLQTELLQCVQGVITVSQTHCAQVSLPLFSVLLSVLALHRKDNIKEQAGRLLVRLAEVQGMQGPEELYQAHSQQVLHAMCQHYAQWMQHSVDRLVFDTLIYEAGPVVGLLLEDIMPMIQANLQPEKDAEVRLKFFSLLSRLLMNASATLDSQHKFGAYGVSVVRDMILPNCVWKAGRIAAAIRTTAVSCLWALLQSKVLTTEQLSEVLSEVATQLRSTLEDDNKSTRLLSCRVLTHLFTSMGATLDQHMLHNMYPDLLKRLDDSSDDIRRAVCKTFVAYFACFESGYNVALYRAHLEALYRGLLVHLDDPDHSIQEAVLEVLLKSAGIDPQQLMHEVDAVKHKHRSTTFCDQLTKYITSGDFQNQSQ